MTEVNKDQEIIEVSIKLTKEESEVLTKALKNAPKVYLGKEGEVKPESILTENKTITDIERVLTERIYEILNDNGDSIDHYVKAASMVGYLTDLREHLEYHK